MNDACLAHQVYGTISADAAAAVDALEGVEVSTHCSATAAQHEQASSNASRGAQGQAAVSKAAAGASGADAAAVGSTSRAGGGGEAAAAGVGPGAAAAGVAVAVAEQHAVEGAAAAGAGAAADQEHVFERVAVGGTFDRLHAGHRLLLAATALTATHQVYVGVTGGRRSTGSRRDCQSLPQAPWIRGNRGRCQPVSSPYSSKAALCFVTGRPVHRLSPKLQG